MAELNRIPGAKSLIDRTFARLRRLALWTAWWPFVTLLGVFLIAVFLGVFEEAPAQFAALATLIALIGGGIAIWRGFNRYRRPDRADAISELDQQSDLRPLVSLADRPARPEKDGITLWQAHETRLTDEVRRLNAPDFAAGWKKSDPLYLRYAVPVLLIGTLAFNWEQAQSRLAGALDPDYGSLFGAENVRIEAWIAPPTHTGRAPIFLKDDQAEVRVPAGSVMTLRVQAPSAPYLRVRNDDGTETTKFSATPDGAYEITADIATDSAVSVRWWGERKAWNVLASPDSPPEVEFVDMPVLGAGDRTEFSWIASDDYGVSKLELAIKPVGEDRKPDLVSVELGGISPREAEEDSKLDLTRNRWAGARVEVRLKATDGAGQVGYSEPFEFKLPEKLLLQPLAKAIQDVRVTVLREDNPYSEAESALDSTDAGAFYVSATQRLQQAPAGVQRGAIMLEAVTYEAPRYFRDVLVYSGLETARYALDASLSTEEAKSTEPLLWSLALRAEYGSAADAYAALMAAKKALEDALRDGASEEEIARLMEAFKDAAQRYIAAKMAEALANGLEAAPDNRDSAEGPGGSGLGGQGFSDMLDALEDLTETGATDQARQLLADITNMLENLEFQQGSGSGEGFPGMPGEQGENENDEDLPEEEREMTETMRELSDLLREQRELNDETLAEQRGERGQSGQSGQQNPGENQPGSEGDPQTGDGLDDVPDWMQDEDGRSLSERQDGLADRIEELAENQIGSGEDGEGEGAGGLDEDTLEAIERSQRRAGNALEDGNQGRAIRNQEQATRQLRELAEGLAEQLDAARADRLGDPQPDGSSSADPFGRSTTGAVDDSNTVDVPDEAERQRAKDILDELRRRYDEAVDEDEREYLERLLDRF
ncbi:MAG: DUF4175 family protein [Pseudomonadota bacterium]